MLGKTSGHCSLLLGQQWRFICKYDKGGMRAITPNIHFGAQQKGFGAPFSCTNMHQVAVVVGEDDLQETQDNSTDIRCAGSKLFNYLGKNPLSHHDIEDIEQLLCFCRKKGDHVLALQLNTYLCEIGLEALSSIGNYLVLLLSEVGSIDLALKVFNKLTYRPNRTWNSLVTGYIISQNPLRALTLYQELKEGFAISFSRYTFVALLKVCTQLKEIERGLEIHADVARTGLLGTDVFIGSILVDMYAKCGLLIRAQEVFDYLPARDVVLWNAIITGYANHQLGEQALSCFEQMQLNSFSPTEITFVSILKACSCVKTLGKCQQLHSTITIGLLDKNIVIGNALIDMYAKCGSILRAWEVFDKLQARDVVSWNTLITGYLEHGHDKEAIMCFASMQHDGIFPDAVTFLCGLKACGNSKLLDKGLALHAEVERKGLLETDLVVGNALVDMYARCGFPYRAHQVVNQLPLQCTVTWNALITGYVNQGHNEEALVCFKDMQLNNGVCPDAATFICTLKASGSLRIQDKVSEIHAEAERRGLLESDLLVGSTLVDAYAKCGLLSQAQEVFERLPMRGVVAWTALISGYTEHGYANEALKGLRQMQCDGLIPDAVTYACILKACAIMKDSEKGQEIHAEIDKLGLLRTDLLVASALVDMYVKSDMLVKARIVFDKLTIRDVVTWNALITGYVDHGQSKEAIELFERLQSEGLSATNVTYACILKACGSIGDIDKGQEIHAELSRIDMSKGSLSVGNTLINMYAKSGLMFKAQEVFDKLPSRDTVSWNALLTGYVEHGQSEKALNCFQQMERDGVPPDQITLIYGLKACGSSAAIVEGCDIHAEIERSGFLKRDLSIATNLVDMYAKCGMFSKAHEVFDKLSVQDVVAWTTLIAGYAEHGYGEDALSCFERMQLAGLHPDAFTFVWSLKACAILGAKEKGQEIHVDIERKGLLERDLVLANTLLDMYVKCGLLTKAHQVFEKLPNRDVISWNCLLLGYSQLGESEHAFHVFERMLGEGLKPGPVSFTIILSACSRIGLFDRGQSYFEVMCKDHGITPSLEHHTCMVDLLCRCGQLQQAFSMVRKLTLSTDLAVWHALLTSCTNWGNIELGKRAFQRAVQVNKQHATSYTFMSKLFLDRVAPTVF